jgi:predicted XRE-type DNA-binding protein
MKRTKSIVAKNPKELGEALGISSRRWAEIELRSDLNDKIIEVVQKRGLTHQEVADLAETARTRITKLLNRNASDISTDLMLRVLFSLGVAAKVRFENVA